MPEQILLKFEMPIEMADIKLAAEELEKLESAGKEEESGKKDATAEASRQEQAEEPE